MIRTSISLQVRNGNGNVSTIVKQSSSREMFARVISGGYARSTSAGVLAPKVIYANKPIASEASVDMTIELVDTLLQVFGFRSFVGSDSYAIFTT
jgi:hypothetical protein